MSRAPKQKDDILHELLGGRYVGGTLSQLANYSDLFQKMSEAVFLIDRHSLRVVECNPSALKLLGLNEAELLGKEIDTVLGDGTDFGKALVVNLKKFQKQTDYRLTSEFEHRALDGDLRYFDLSAASLKILDYIEVIQLIARDVTEVKKAHRELQEMNEALKNLSTTDAMTGLRNYRYFKEVLASVHHQAVNFKHEYGIIFIDVDHFKKFNDQNGHPAGDEVLRRVAATLKSVQRNQDLSCRYGGEEFVVLCRDSSIQETKKQAEVIRMAIEKTDFPHGEKQPLGRVTISVGVSGFPTSGLTFEDVLKRSDDALYESKQGGRNRVTSVDDLPKKIA